MNPHGIDDLDWNTGDWFNEIQYMLGKRPERWFDPTKPNDRYIIDDKDARDSHNGLPYGVRRLLEEGKIK
jgi:hypothetical protein